MNLSQTDFSWSDNLPDLVLKSFEGSLTDEELQELRTRLNNDESARLFFADSAVLQSLLESHFALPLDVDVESMTTTSSRSKNPLHYFLINKNVLFLSLCAGFWCGAILLTYFLFFSSEPAPEVADNHPTHNILKTDNTQNQEDEIQNASQHILKEGSVDLILPSGANLSIVAPAIYRVTGKNSIHLQQGILTAEVPQSAIGFTVNTPRGRVVDLGTIFGVEVDASGTSSVQVFKGNVELFSSTGTKTPLAAGKTMRAEAGKEEWQPSEKLSDEFYAVSKKHSSGIHFFHEPSGNLLGPDGFTGVLYVMYSATPLKERHTVPAHKDEQWKYCTKNFFIVSFDETAQKWTIHINQATVEFTPVATDLILARIDVVESNSSQKINKKHRVTFYQENYGTTHGISHGYQTSDIQIRPDWTNGIEDISDHTLTGTYFIRKPE